MLAKQMFCGKVQISSVPDRAASRYGAQQIVT